MKNAIALLMLMVTAASVTAQVDDDAFRPGYYINRKGSKVEGWIRYTRGYKRFEYKAAADAKKTAFVVPYSCSEFVIDSARFVRNPGPVTVRYGGWNRNIGEDFLQVFAEGRISLYKHYGEMESKTKYDYTPVKVESVIVRKDKGPLLALTGNEDRDREKLEALFPGERDVVKALMGKDWKETIQFVRAYNAK